jgi:hypothetical protein
MNTRVPVPVLDTRTSSPAEHGRAWWRSDAARAGSDWHGLVPVWWVASTPCVHCGLTPLDDPWPEPQSAPPPPPKRRSTPRATIEAIMHCVRQRGAAALREPANIERLSCCDGAARAEINRRVAKQRIAPT